ncbi:hypothetical protein HMPREF9531_02776 [Escherichia coli MS 45-1]|nr:hypothetical protein HMPREF9531_02776 [Escherichia coli MS 45-1]
MFIDNAANAAFNAQTIGMILIIENEIFAQNIVEKRNGKEIFGKLAQRVAVEKEVRLIEIDLQIVVHHQWRQRFFWPTASILQRPYASG